MKEDENQSIVRLLTEINNHLREINGKFDSNYNLSDVCSKLDDLDRRLSNIEDNTEKTE